MDQKKQIILIQLSVAQTKKYFEIASSKTTAEMDEDCLPSGVTIEVDVIPPFGTVASVEGKSLGHVAFDIIDID